MFPNSVFPKCVFPGGVFPPRASGAPPTIDYVALAELIVNKFAKDNLHVGLDTHVGLAAYFESVFGVGAIDYTAAANIAFKYREKQLYTVNDQVTSIAYILQYNLHIAD